MLDNSLSSGAVAGGVRALDDLAARARETLRAARAGDELWLIGADGVARRGTGPELLAEVDASTPQPERLDLSAAVATAARLVRASAPGRGEIHLLSDLQRTAFGAPDSAAAGLPLLVYHPAADPPPNRAVVAARASPATWLAGRGGGAVAVTVGGAPSPAPAGGKVPVTVSIAGRAGSRSLVAAGDVTLMQALAPAPGWAAGEASLEPDELRADDQRPFAVRVVRPAVVSAGPPSDIGAFLAAALASLAAAGEITLGAGPGAVHLGSGGGGRNAEAVVLPPADPVGLGPANRALAAAGVPWRFGALLDREDTLAAPRVPELAGVRVLRRRPLVPAGTGGAEPSGVLARAGNDPWLVRSGRTVVLGSRLVPDETALPLSSRFVPFVGLLVNRLARGDEGILDATPGASLPLPAGVSALLPALPAGPLAGGPGAAGSGAGGPGAARPIEGSGTFTAPTVPGVYLMLEGADTAGALVVAPDPRESDLRRATPSELSALFPGARIETASSPQAYAAERFRGAGRSELTGWLLAGAILLLLVEALVAAGGLARSA